MSTTTAANCHICMKEEKKMKSTVGGGEMNKNAAAAEYVTTKQDTGEGGCHDKVDTEESSFNLKPGDSKPTAASSLDKQQLDNKKNDDEVSRKCLEEDPATEALDISVTKKAESEEIVGEAAVQVLNLVVQSPDRTEDDVIPIPFRLSTSKSTLFTLKEGSKYRIIFNFVVSGKKTVSSLKYVGDVWKKGIKVDHCNKMIGTSFCPRKEAYIFEVENATTPSGFFARGSYSARAKFVDDDGNTYLDTIYYFDIARTWASFSK